MGTYNNNCGNGVTALIQTACPDMNAVGIQNISQSADLTKMYITLTTGQTLTFILPQGQGLPGAVAIFQVNNNQVQYSYNGTTWTTLYTIPLATLWNDFTGASTSSTGSFQLLNSQILKANSLVNVGDNVKMKYIMTCATPDPINIQQVQLTLNGVQLVNLLFGNAKWNAFIFDVVITLVSATSANIEVCTTASTASSGVGSGKAYQAVSSFYESTLGVTGFNFATNQTMAANGLNGGGTTVVNYQQGRADLFIL